MRPFGRLLSEGGGKRGLGRVWDVNYDEEKEEERVLDKEDKYIEE